jgi:hypothetical protein
MAPATRSTSATARPAKSQDVSAVGRTARTVKRGSRWCATPTMSVAKNPNSCTATCSHISDAAAPAGRMRSHMPSGAPSSKMAAKASNANGR